MNKEELLKEIMKLPKAETINPISTMNSINVDDLMSAVDRLNKVPTYDELLKENRQLKKVIDKTIEELKKGLNELDIRRREEVYIEQYIEEALNILKEVE